MDGWVTDVPYKTRIVIATQVRAEMREDPKWKHRGQWEWEKYFQWARSPTRFGTYVNVQVFVMSKGIGVEVY